MPHGTKTAAVPALVTAWLMSAALLGTSAATAQERITLETIGAVRMAGSRLDDGRRVNPQVRPAETGSAQEQRADDPSKAH